jgi:CRISPR-associated protein Csb2
MVENNQNPARSESQGGGNVLVSQFARTKQKLHKPAHTDGPKIARYLRFSLQCRVPIASKFTVTLAELFRAAANYHLCKVHGQGAKSPALLGKDVAEGHQHAFYLPMSQDHSLTDLHVWCPMGLTRAEVDVLLRIRRLSWGNGRFPVNPVLTAMSMEPPADAKLAVGDETAQPLKSRIWRSETPFVPPLHFYRGDKSNPKLRANATPEHQLVTCLRHAGLDKAVTIERLPAFQTDRSTEQEGNKPHMPAWDIVRAPEGDDVSAMAFDQAIEVATHQNTSSNHKAHQRRIGFFIRLTFEEPTALPMPSFGHSSHFGLGLFVPAEPS